MTKFQVGDRVKTNYGKGGTIIRGWRGQITTPSNGYYVKLDNFEYEPSDKDRWPDGEGHVFYDGEMTLMKEEKPQKKEEKIEVAGNGKTKEELIADMVEQYGKVIDKYGIDEIAKNIFFVMSTNDYETQRRFLGLCDAINEHPAHMLGYLLKTWMDEQYKGLREGLGLE